MMKLGCEYNVPRFRVSYFMYDDFVPRGLAGGAPSLPPLLPSEF